MIKAIAEVFFVDNGKILLVQQRKESAYGLWSFPGGKLEPGETPEEAAHREVLEELSCKITNLKPFKTYDHQSPTALLKLYGFTGELNGTIKLKDDELLAYGWFSLDSIATNQIKLRSPRILEQIKEVLQTTA